MKKNNNKDHTFNKDYIFKVGTENPHDVVLQ